MAGKKKGSTKTKAQKKAALKKIMGTIGKAADAANKRLKGKKKSDGKKKK